VKPYNIEISKLKRAAIRRIINSRLNKLKYSFAKWAEVVKWELLN